MQAIGKLIFLRLFCNTLLVVLCFKQRKRDRGDDANVYFLNQTFSKCISNRTHFWFRNSWEENNNNKSNIEYAVVQISCQHSGQYSMCQTTKFF